MSAVTAEVALPQPAPAKAPWIVSARFDLFFFVASAGVVLLPWIAAEHLGVRSIFILAAVGLLSNGPHLASTWSRVYLDGNERWRRPIHYWVIPALIACAVIGMVYVEGRRSNLLFSVVFYWAFWHFLAQNWGIVRIYQRKQGDVAGFDARLERAVLWAGALAPFVWRLANGPTKMFGAKVIHPVPPSWAPAAIAGVAIGLAAVYLYRIAMRAREGRPIAWIRPVFLAACAFGFFVPFVLIRKVGSAAFAAAAAWHGLQYIGIVWHYNRHKWAGGVDPKAKLVSWMSQPRRTPVYFAVLLGLVSIAFGVIQLASLAALDAKTWGVLIWNSMTLGHYWLDGVIWKLRRPEVARHLV